MSDLVINTADAALGDRHIHVDVTLCDVNGTAVVVQIGDDDVVATWTGHTDSTGHLVVDLTPNANIAVANTHYLVELKAGKTTLWSEVITKGASSERLLECERPTPPDDLPAGVTAADIPYDPVLDFIEGNPTNVQAAIDGLAAELQALQADPPAHALSHAGPNGSDVVPIDASQIVSGTIDPDRLP